MAASADYERTPAKIIRRNYLNRILFTATEFAIRWEQMQWRGLRERIFHVKGIAPCEVDRAHQQALPTKLHNKSVIYKHTQNRFRLGHRSSQDSVTVKKNSAWWPGARRPTFLISSADVYYECSRLSAACCDALWLSDSPCAPWLAHYLSAERVMALYRSSSLRRRSSRREGPRRCSVDAAWQDISTHDGLHVLSCATSQRIY